VALVLRPFSSRRSSEIIAAPKVYGSTRDSCALFAGWTSLRPDAPRATLEHYVLNELTAQLQVPSLRYWRDKQGP